MNVSILLVAFLPALLSAAAMFDLTTYTIPNLVNGAMLALFVIVLVTLAILGHPVGLLDTAMHVLAGCVGLAAGMALFAAGWVGGGDAKLFAVASLWLGWDAFFHYTVLATLLGGCLTSSLLIARRIPLPRILAEQPWLARLTDRNEGVPYGVALAMAALTVLPDTELFRLAATS